MPLIMVMKYHEFELQLSHYQVVITRTLCGLVKHCGI